MSLLGILSEVTSSLTKASGLSLSLSKAAFGVDSLVQDSKLYERLESETPASPAEECTLYEAGVHLYNVTRRGPPNDVYILRLQLLSCFAMRAGTTCGAVELRDRGIALKKLDTLRCFSKTGLLLMNVRELEPCTRALSAALDLAEGGGDAFFHNVQGVFGNTQEAHDCGAAYFAALCGLLETQFETLSDGRVPASGRKKHVEGMLLRLKNNSSFLARVPARKREVLRQIIEKGLPVLSADESVLFQSCLFQLWDALGSWSPGLQQALAARLAFGLARTNDAVASVAALERAENVEEVSFAESKENAFGMHLARCAVACVQLASERRIAALSSAHHHHHHAAAALAAQTFHELTMDFSFSSGADEELALESADELFRCCVGVAEDAFECSYGRLLAVAAPDVDVQARVLVRALEKCPESTVAVLHRTELGLVASGGAGHARRRVRAALWGTLSTFQRDGRWDVVSLASEAAVGLCKDKEDPDLQSRAMQARVLASLHSQLPDPTGDALREQAVLERGLVSVRLASTLARSEPIRGSAALLQLSCLVRLAALDAASSMQAAVDGFRALLQSGGLRGSADVLQVVNDALAVRAEPCAVRLAEHARDHFVGVAAWREARSITRWVVDVKLKCRDTCSAARDALQVLEGGDEKDDGIRAWLWRAFAPLCVSDRDENKDEDECLNTASALVVVFRCSGEEDAAMSVAGGLMASAVRRGGSSLGRLGESAFEALAQLTSTRKSHDPRAAHAALFAFLFMGTAVPDSGRADDAVLERLEAFFREDTYAVPSRAALHLACTLARTQLGFPRTAKMLLVRVAQTELREGADPLRVVEQCLCALLVQAADRAEAEGWADQIAAALTSTAGVPAPQLLELAALAFWRMRAWLSGEQLCCARSWLLVACNASPAVLAQRAQLLAHPEWPSIAVPSTEPSPPHTSVPSTELNVVDQETPDEMD